MKELLLHALWKIFDYPWSTPENPRTANIRCRPFIHPYRSEHRISIFCNYFSDWKPEKVSTKNWRRRVNELGEAIDAISPAECCYIFYRTLPSTFGKEEHRGWFYNYYMKLDNDQIFLSTCGFLVYPPDYDLTSYLEDATILAELEQARNYLCRIQDRGVKPKVFFCCRDPQTVSDTSSFMKHFLARHDTQMPRIRIVPGSGKKKNAHVVYVSDKFDQNTLCISQMLMACLKRGGDGREYNSKGNVTSQTERHSWFCKTLNDNVSVWRFDPEKSSNKEWANVLSALANSEDESKTVQDYSLNLRFDLLSRLPDHLVSLTQRS